MPELPELISQEETQGRLLPLYPARGHGVGPTLEVVVLPKLRTTKLLNRTGSVVSHSPMPRMAFRLGRECDPWQPRIRLGVTTPQHLRALRIRRHSPGRHGQPGDHRSPSQSHHRCPPRRSLGSISGRRRRRSSRAPAAGLQLGSEHPALRHRLLLPASSRVDRTRRATGRRNARPPPIARRRPTSRADRLPYDSAETRRDR